MARFRLQGSRVLAVGDAAAQWRSEERPLIEREHAHPIYAVTGATISSRALTSGVGVTVERFRRRWQLLAPYFARGGAS